MRTIDERFMHAPMPACFRVAADVERWPEILPHYRWVRFHEKRAFGHGRVEMAAWRDFPGPLRYPTWWLSEMEADADIPIVRYRHVDGITRGMDVRWEFEPREDGTHVRVLHIWDGPRWPLIGSLAANLVIGPRFIHVIAQRTLAGVAAEAERRAAAITAGGDDLHDAGTTDDDDGSAPPPND
ncbi:MAG: SRPBCC family protein [Gemmatimonadota bacterium]